MATKSNTTSLPGGRRIQPRKCAASTKTAREELLPTAASATISAVLPSLMVLMVLVAANSVPAALAGEVVLHNSTLIVSNGTCEFGVLETALQDAVLTAAALNNAGRRRRAEHAMGYLCPDKVSLCGEQAVLESSVEIEANNSHIVVQPPNTTFTSLYLALNQNNTLHMYSKGQGPISISSSTLAIGPPAAVGGGNNWFYITNNTVLQLLNSRLNFTDGQAWVVEDSTVATSQSIVELTNTILYGNGSSFVFSSATLWRTQPNIADDAHLTINVHKGCRHVAYPARYIHSDPVKTAPPTVGGASVVHQPYIWLENSDMSVFGSLVIMSNVTALLTNSTLLLTDSTLQLYNTTLELWASPLGLNNSRVELYDGSMINFYCGSVAVFENIVTAANLTNPITLPRLAGTTQGLVGEPLGTVDTVLYDEPYGVLVLSAPGEKSGWSRGRRSGARDA
ncbi:hypothetical protein VOLCADRAFT_87578 [Volvox carteri f. nagariensis]|uniref:Uncharacterized protein n=1 Tax=Volvox carteri f. nagariensis TaxID=3068 RepID=D8TLP1_VOLCA|nr:uncharacterized protein VOLCADRAFT_87578 [Volvox carteri f. nagariensis]EFJ51500.1 hypothetical protein VOLCADRAFT_87578 [Volvox carteri f. nagariensis]|eukprot:XP_002947452.1 hypothetical protein VOLCADRAFT_87578 [Volvox carteri f. nagariensis]